MITAAQLKQIQTLLSKKFSDREERLAFVSDFFSLEINSIKELSEKQAFQLIKYLKEGKTINNSFFARFNPKNPQHLNILSCCHKLCWVQKDNPNFVDLNRLGSFLISKHSPVKKPLF